MDKLMDNRWFMKGIALLLAILLYSAVQDKDQSAEISVPGDQNTESIAGVPVNSYYDTENLVISGIPNTVEVTLQGPMPQVQAAKALKNFEVYIDLANIKIGNHTVPLRIRDVSEKLKVQIEPAYANINVQERVTKEFKVEAEYDTGLLEEGYEADKPIVEPSKVLITGAKETIDRITYVKATIDIKEKFNATITREAKVRVLDRELNKLDVVVEPEIVEVTIPVISAQKTVPIKIVENGTTQNGISIDKIELDINEATIIGPEDLLEKTDNVRVEVDLSKISDDTTLTLPVIIPNGITNVTPQLVKANIEVTKLEERTFSNLSIEALGLSDSYDLEYLDPSNATVNLTVSGTNEEIQDISLDDFMVYVDLTNLSTGNHGVEIQVEGPAQLSWKLNKPIAQVSITEKEV